MMTILRTPKPKEAIIQITTQNEVLVALTSYGRVLKRGGGQWYVLEESTKLPEFKED